MLRLGLEGATGRPNEDENAQYQTHRRAQPLPEECRYRPDTSVRHRSLLINSSLDPNYASNSTRPWGSTPREDLATQLRGELATLDRDPSIDQEVNHPLRQLVRVLEISGIVQSLQIEDDDIGDSTPTYHSPIL